MDENLSVNTEQVAETPVDVVDTTVSEGVDNVEVTEPQGQEVESTSDVPTKPEQDSETNHRFAEMRREKEQYARELAERDAWVTKNFGDYGVETWADYQAQMERQIQEQYEANLRENGIEPEVLNEYVEKDPRVQKAKELEAQAQAEEAKSNDALEFFKTNPDIKPDDIPTEVMEAWSQGKSMAEAYKDWDYNRLKSMDMNTIKQSAVTEYIEKIKKGNMPVEGSGSAPVMKTEPPTDFKTASNQAFEILRNSRLK